jgi:hypothetical protein
MLCELHPSRAKAGSSDAGAQFKRLRALINGNVDRVLEGRIGFSSGFRRWIEQQQFAALKLKHGNALLAQCSDCVLGIRKCRRNRMHKREANLAGNLGHALILGSVFRKEDHNGGQALTPM